MNELVIDGRVVTLPSTDGMLLGALAHAGVVVPVLCHDPRLSPQGSCGVCVVEIRHGDGWRPVPACATPVSSVEEVRTQSEALVRSRRWTLELLFSNHSPAAKFHPDRSFGGSKPPLVCACRGHRSCTLRNLCLEVEAEPDALGRPASESPPELLRTGIELEMSKCVRCDRCVRICREVVEVEALSFARRGHDTTLVYAAPADPELVERCDRCAEGGALCIDTCPTDALHPPRPAKLKVVKS
jgi:NADH dehydrogenase/NADH:ubiquinone oxidoreductase subunit G